jgi:WD40 repeat protein
MAWRWRLVLVIFFWMSCNLNSAQMLPVRLARSATLLASPGSSFFGLGSPIVVVQDNLQASDVYPLSLSSGASARVFPSPDGQLVAYDSSIRLNSHVDRYLTISTIAPDDEPAYFEKPEDLPRGFEADAASPYLPFAWSPDGTRLAVTSQPLVTLTDTDLWIFNLVDETWTNLADDGYSGAITAEQHAPAGTIIDVQPTWSPDGTKVAVERMVMRDDGQRGQARLTVIDAETGEARDLAGLPELGTTTTLSWSPDGAALALTVLHQTPNTVTDGLWIVDVSTGDMHQQETLEEIAGALHEVLPDLELTSVGPVAWSPDSTRLLLWAGQTGRLPVMVLPLIVDLTSGDMTPLPIPAHPRDTTEALGLRPLQAAWSPDGEGVLIFTFGLHPDEDTTSLDPDVSNVRGAVRLIRPESGISELVGYLPLGITPLYYAAWGEGNQAVIDGYHLTLQP